MTRRTQPNPVASVVLLPDAAPLITLACADALDLLMKPGWAGHLVDGVLHEVTRNITPTSQLIARCARRHRVQVLLPESFQKVSTRVFLMFPEPLDRVGR